MNPRLMAALAGIALCSPAYALKIEFAGNGHSYEIFEARGISWADANAAAIASGGYLATLTDAAENQFVFDVVVEPVFGTGNGGNDGVQAWIGGYQSDSGLEPDGGWQWVTGEAWSFTNWAGGEPNNSGGNEDHLAINRFGDWRWNDEGAWTGGVRGYVVEYNRVPDGGMTALLLALGLGSMAAVRRKLNR